MSVEATRSTEMTLYSRTDSDADEFHDALDHLEEEDEEEYHVAVAEAATIATNNEIKVDKELIEEDSESSIIHSYSSGAEQSLSVYHSATDEKASEPPPQPTRECDEVVTDENSQSDRSATSPLYRLDSNGERICSEIEVDDELLRKRSLFDALSGSGSEELENAELTNTPWSASLSNGDAEVGSSEVQYSDERDMIEDIRDHEEHRILHNERERINNGQNKSNRSSYEDIAFDTATNKSIDGEEGGKVPIIDLTNDAKLMLANESQANEDSETNANGDHLKASTTKSKEVEEIDQHSINGDAVDKGQKQSINEKESASEEEIEEGSTKITISASTESSFDTPTKSPKTTVNGMKSIADEISEQFSAESDQPEEKSNDDQSPLVKTPEIPVQEQLVVDGEYTTPKKIDCDELCDMGSPLEALFLFCQGKKSGLEIDTTNKDIEVPLRTTSFRDADPKAPAPLSPVEDVHCDYESDSSEDSSIDSISRFRMMKIDDDYNAGTNCVDRKGSNDSLDLLPDRKTLEYKRSLSARSSELDQVASCSFDESLSAISTGSKPDSPKSNARRKANELKQKLKRGVAGLSAKKGNRKRTVSSEELPSNAVYVRSSKTKSVQTCLPPSSSEDSPTLSQTDSSFNPMLLVKTIQAHQGPAWCAAFSDDGSFLATGGEDGNVAIWAVSPKSKKLHPKGVSTKVQEKQNAEQKNETEPLSFIGLGPEMATNVEIVSSEPIQRYCDHTADVIDLSWSHTNFLLTASVDKSVRLYHFSKSKCLHLFKHANLVASVDFHPLDDRYFISGGLDKKLRMWNITDGRVKEWAGAPEVITSTRYSPDGKYAVAGLLRGQVYLYEADGLKYFTQIACRNRSGKNRKGKKVTGISFLRDVKNESERTEDDQLSFTERLAETGRTVANMVASTVLGNSDALSTRRADRMLVSTNDSRVRLYGLNDFCLIRKYKGHTNNSMQIRARVSDSGLHIASGSESGHCFIWDVNKNGVRKKNKQVQSTKDKTKWTSYFEASKASLPIVTDTLFFPTEAVRESLLTSGEMFPVSLGMDRVEDDFSSAAILTLDYDGAIRVFVRKTCIENIAQASVPRDGTMT